MSEFMLGLFYPTGASIHLLSPLATELNRNLLDAKTHIDVIKAAENAGLNYAFCADAWGSRGPISTRLGLSDPMLLAPVLASLLLGVTDRIKVITTINQTFFHPLLIARIGANLDALSGGRWGMNAVTGTSFAPGLATSVVPERGHDDAYAAAGESMDILFQAWHNDGNVDYQGKYYQVKGRIVGPQAVTKPHPWIISAGASDAGCEFAGRYATLNFIPGRASAEFIAGRREKIRAAARAAGRDGSDVKIALHVSVIAKETQEEADELSVRLHDSVDLAAVVEYLGAMAAITTYNNVFDKSTEAQLRDTGLTGGARKIHGDAKFVANNIALLKEETGCDCISLSFPL